MWCCGGVMAFLSNGHLIHQPATEFGTTFPELARTSHAFADVLCLPSTWSQINSRQDLPDLFLAGELLCN